MNTLRIGHGYDIHRFTPGRPLVLGGVKFDTDYGLDGHSDADVITHAICDSLLGAAGLPDIGHFFPNTNPAFKDIDSQLLLKSVITELGQRGYRVINVDVSVIAEKPRLISRIGEMKNVLGRSMDVTADCVGIKATTNEGVGDLGRGLAIAAHAVALIGRA
ncbi:MAG: 2-C-methyl-D-erythritol 2,4-cyclodiphosphate synthase [Opitutales bacterium]